jgi:hypothetical protein
MARVDWDCLPADVRQAIEEGTGPPTRARTVSEGLNSEIAVIVDTAAGQVFIKGRPVGRAEQQREAAVNPYVRHVAPRLLWRVVTGGWDLLGFEWLAGRHADYAPGSDDLDSVVKALHQLGETRCPEHPEIRQAERRWSSYLDDRDDAGLLAGNTLLHTDLNPLNVLVHHGTARLIDWAWPTRGAGFIDPACWLVRLIAAGHSPESAEGWASRCPAFATAPNAAITVFAHASSRMWDEIEQHERVPWKQDMAKAAHQWREFRGPLDK